jgi:hypothetical protein
MADVPAPDHSLMAIYYACKISDLKIGEWLFKIGDRIF